MVSEALVDFLSGSAGGVANVVVGQPMDTVKVFHVMFGRESKEDLNGVSCHAMSHFNVLLNFLR